MAQHLLEGEVLDAKDQRIADLETEVRRLRRVATDAETEAGRAREDANRALSELRRQLSPLYRALQMVFGELDAAGVPDEPSANGGNATAPPVNDRAKAVWDSWKSRLPPSCGKVIDALLLHGELSREQLKVAARMGSSTVDAAIGRMNRAGLIDKNGGKYGLKKL